ncbi:hypothetical protein lbkm_1870 [Lachnospiraceae bacterium KM106-2]|nr:hypothetical protein lbkm_1870 [Lachnospiraceae bacterium KM106-2]
MNTEQLFIKNRDLLNEKFSFENREILLLCASIAASKQKEVSCDKIKECKQYIKDNTGWFSVFRGKSYFTLATLLSLLDEDYRAVFGKVKKTFEGLKEQFGSSDYLPMTAYFITQTVEEDQYGQVFRRTKEFYQAMKEKHRFLTGREDVSFAALFAISDLSITSGVGEMEACYTSLRKTSITMDALQTLSHVLALAPMVQREKCERVVAILDGLRSKGIKYGMDSETAVIGILASIEIPVEEVIQAIMEKDSFLKEQKGFKGFFGSSNRERFMHAAMLVSYQYANEIPVYNVGLTASITSVTSMVIAQEAAMMAAMSASMAAAAASTQTNS